MLLGTAASMLQPAGGAAAMAILGLLGVQAALFSPSKYGILPEILPHEKLSSGNGLMEMWANLAIIGGTVAGGVIVSLTGGDGPGSAGLSSRSSRPPAWLAALGVPHVPVARSEGGLVETLKIGWSAIRADRILRLAICGQIFVWSIASLVPAPVLTYAIARSSASRNGRRACRSRRSASASASARSRRAGSRRSRSSTACCRSGPIGLTLSTLAFGLLGPGLRGDDRAHGR